MGTATVGGEMTDVKREDTLVSRRPESRSTAASSSRLLLTVQLLPLLLPHGSLDSLRDLSPDLPTSV